MHIAQFTQTHAAWQRCFRQDAFGAVLRRRRCCPRGTRPTEREARISWSQRPARSARATPACPSVYDFSRSMTSTVRRRSNSDAASAAAISAGTFAGRAGHRLEHGWAVDVHREIGATTGWIPLRALLHGQERTRLGSGGRLQATACSIPYAHAHPLQRARPARQQDSRRCVLARSAVETVAECRQ